MSTIPLYRGQVYGEPVGEWWTTSPAEAEKFAMSRGGNRNYIVVCLSPDAGWASRFLTFEKAGDEGGDWYRIPLDDLRYEWRSVSIVSGAMEVPNAR